MPRLIARNTTHQQLPLYLQIQFIFLRFMFYLQHHEAETLNLHFWISQVLFSIFGICILLLNTVAPQTRIAGWSCLLFSNVKKAILCFYSIFLDMSFISRFHTQSQEYNIMTVFIWNCVIQPPYGTRVLHELHEHTTWSVANYIHFIVLVVYEYYIVYDGSF